jgi:large subunit ribosomal protein L24
MPNLNIKKGDTVYILSGRSRQARLSPEERERTEPTELKHAAEKHPGRRAQVLRVMPSQGKVVVEGANLVTKHNRRGRTSSRVSQAQTGRIQQPAPLPVSKVMLVCPRCDRPTRPRPGVHEGKKVRVCRHCSEIVDTVR